MAAAVSFPPQEREPLIVLSHVSKDYDTGGGLVRAMRDVDLRIDHGEFVAIVGTSGSGKSTMMNILGCLDRPTRGTYSLAGLDVGSRAGDSRAIVRNRVIGFIFQGFNLLPRTTALENCELPLQYRGVGSRARRKRAEEVLAQVGLADRMDHKPNQLSGGQQQRVAIARALVTDPPLLLADEPTGNLDTRTSLEVLALLQRLNKENGITIGLVTHEHDIAACASRVITVRDGKIVSDVRQEAPLDAAAALAPPQVYESDAAPASMSPRERILQRLGGPVPLSLYAAMFGAGIGGAVLGAVYDGVVLGQRVAWVVALCMVVAEAWAGARLGAKRQQGKPLTTDQRGRVAVLYTCGVTLPLAAAVLALAVNKLPLPWLDGVEHLSSGGVALAL